MVEVLPELDVCCPGITDCVHLAGLLIIIPVSKGRTVKLRVPGVYFLFGFISDTDVLGGKEDLQGKRERTTGELIVSDQHISCGKIEILPQIILYVGKECGQAYTWFSHSCGR